MSFFDVIQGKNVLHITDSDLDGVSARLVGEYYLQDSCTYLPFNTAKRDMSEVDWNLVMNSDIVLFTDITPSVRLYRTMLRSRVEFYIFDHHETGKQELGEHSNYYYTTEKCGAKIFYDYLLEQGAAYNHTLDRLITLTDTYDRWQHESEDWKEAKNLSNVMFGYVNWFVVQSDTGRYEPFIDAQLRKLEKADHFFFTPKEKKSIDTALTKEEKNFKVARENLQIRKDNQGNIYGYAECTAKLSFVAHRLLRESPEELDYIAMYGNFDSTNRKISLRSASMDVSEIASTWGGGGHEGAAAFEFENLEQLHQFKAGQFHLI